MVRNIDVKGKKEKERIRKGKPSDCDGGLTPIDGGRKGWHGELQIKNLGLTQREFQCKNDL